MLGRPLDVIIGVDIHKAHPHHRRPQRHRSGPRASEGDSDGAAGPRRPGCHQANERQAAAEQETDCRGPTAGTRPRLWDQTAPRLVSGMPSDDGLVSFSRGEARAVGSDARSCSGG